MKKIIEFDLQTDDIVELSDEQEKDLFARALRCIADESEDTGTMYLEYESEDGEHTTFYGDFQIKNTE